MSEALQLLIEERDKLNRAIEVLGGTVPKRRGRPPGSKTAKQVAKKSSPGRPKMSTAEKKKASERMKKYWAAKRKAATNAA
ncbi:MAG: hypothetical protein O2968_05425 [Acidobacteria bacterium]|nr:hypothetical protein [Acidobacteriota bacterium]